MNPATKKKPPPAKNGLKPGTVVNGFKVVPPPKSPKRRQAMTTDSFTTSGGCRTLHHR